MCVVGTAVHREGESERENRKIKKKKKHQSPLLLSLLLQLILSFFFSFLSSLLFSLSKTGYELSMPTVNTRKLAIHTPIGGEKLLSCILIKFNVQGSLLPFGTSRSRLR